MLPNAQEFYRARSDEEIGGLI